MHVTPIEGLDIRTRDGEVAQEKRDSVELFLKKNAVFAISMRSRKTTWHCCCAAIAVAALLLPSCGGRRARVNAVTPKIGAKEKGIASWYGVPYHGRRTASGEIYDMEKSTAAHKRFAFGTWVLVDNLDNGKKTEVRINDRGPFVRGRVIDLSKSAARSIDMLGPGIAKVRLTVIARRDAPSPTRSPLGSGAATEAPGRYAVQIAAHRDAATSKALADRMALRHHTTRVQEHDGWFRVLVVYGGSAEEAEQLRQSLASEFAGAFVTQIAVP